MNSALVPALMTPVVSAAVDREPTPPPTDDASFGNYDPDVLGVPYAGQTRMQLTLCSGVAEVSVRVDPNATELLTVHTDGTSARLRVSPNEVRVVLPRNFASWLRTAFSGAHPTVELVLHPAVVWTLSVRGGLARFHGDLVAGKLAGIDVSGGMSDATFELPVPTSPVPVRVSGGVSELTLRRPSRTGVSLVINGGVSVLHLDEQEFGAIGGVSRLVSGATDGNTPRYAIEIRGGASDVCVTAH